jgi:oligosaccharide:H+ symporter
MRQSIRLRRESVLLRALYFMYYGSSSSWFPFFNVYLQQLGLTGVQIGSLAGLRPMISVISQPLWGLVSDLWGRRRTLLLSTLLATLTILGFMWIKSFWLFAVWLLLYAFLANPVGPLIDSLVLDHLERRPAASYGPLRMWGAVGWAVMSFSVGRAIAGRDMRLIFCFAALLTFAGFWVILCAFRRGEAGTSFASRWRDLVPVLRNARLLTFLALIVLLQIGASCLFSFYSIYMTELGASSQLIGLAYGIQGISELPVYLLASAIIRRLGAARTIAITFFLSATRALLYSAISQPAWALAVQLMHGTFSLFLVASVQYVNEQVPGQWRATGQSLFWAAYFGLGSILGNVGAGFLYDWLGVQRMFRINGLLVLAVAVFAVWLLRERGQ